MNNSAFTSDPLSKINAMKKIFWQMGMECFRGFFEGLDVIQPKAIEIPTPKKQIEWKSVEISSSTQKISIESNKNEDIKIQQTDKQKQEKMSEYRKNVLGIYKDGYFDGVGKDIKDNWNDNKLLGIMSGLGGIVGTIIPILPAAYAMDKRKQNQIDDNVSNKKECNIDITEFNSYLKEIKYFETLILSKRNKLKEQEKEKDMDLYIGFSDKKTKLKLKHSNSKINLLRMIDIFEEQMSFKQFIRHCTHELSVESILFLIEISQFKATLSKFNAYGINQLNFRFIDVNQCNFIKYIKQQRQEKINKLINIHPLHDNKSEHKNDNNNNKQLQKQNTISSVPHTNTLIPPLSPSYDDSHQACIYI
eukprot:213268_1